MLLPWEVHALHDYLVGEDHWGQDMLGDCEDIPLEGWDKEDENYVYTAGGDLMWTGPPAVVPCLEVSEVRAPPSAWRCPHPWPFVSGEGRPPWWEPARRRADFPPPPRSAPPSPSTSSHPSGCPPLLPPSPSSPSYPSALPIPPLSSSSLSFSTSAPATEAEPPTTAY